MYVFQVVWGALKGVKTLTNPCRKENGGKVENGKTSAFEGRSSTLILFYFSMLICSKV